MHRAVTRHTARRTRLRISAGQGCRQRRSSTPRRPRHRRLVVRAARRGGVSDDLLERRSELGRFDVELPPAASEAEHRHRVAVDGPAEVVVEERLHDSRDRLASEALAKFIWCGHDQCVELVRRRVTGLDRGTPGQTQRAHGFDAAVGGLRCDQVLPGESGPGGRFGVHRAYLLKEQLRLVFQHRGAEAVAMLDAWLEWARRCRIPAFVELYHRIKKHRAGIIAAVTHGLSNGLTESVNTKLRLLTRIAYGFRSTDNLIALCLLDRGGHCPPLPGRPVAA